MPVHRRRRRLPLPARWQSDFQIVAGGLRNRCGLTFDQHWNLFSNDNDHESIPADYVPGRLMHVTPHADFAGRAAGWSHKTPERADLLETMFAGLGRFVPVGQAYYDDDLLARRSTATTCSSPAGVRGP